MNENIQKDSNTVFGFFSYLMSDLVLFAALFAVYAVLFSGTAGGPSSDEIFNVPFALTETLILLTSSLVCGLMLLAARARKKSAVLAGLAAIFLLGATFVTMEVSEFTTLVAAGNGPSKSAFLSSYLTLVGTHGLHVVIGLLWMVALIVSIAARGLTRGNMRKLALFALFWHFIEIIWIFIFAIVYLIGII
jgi:cytochrome o ubiquinol oxidase subunit 3